jgi:Acetyltransferases, including N-acetylases of ribosomal proteins
MLQLETQRLILRPFTQEDHKSVHQYASVPDNVKYMVWGPNDEDATKKFLCECEEKWAAQPILAYEFAIVLKSEAKVIGGCGIYRNNNVGEAMLGWILHRDFWMQGYMPEAAKALLQYGFDKLKLHRIYAICNTENYGSYRVMEKIGMRREAHFIKNRFGRVCDTMQWYDEYHYAILEEEWRSKHE